MLKPVNLAIIFIFALAILASNAFFNIQKSSTLTQIKIKKRESITFILGKDKASSSSYFHNAEDYYRYSKRDRTEYIETSCNSLLDVRNYLNNTSLSNGKPWGVINLVVHSNEWGGLSVPVYKGVYRTTCETLGFAIRNGYLRPLSDRIIDAESEIRIFGCAVGRDRKLLTMISKAFGGIGYQRPVVRATRYFVSYEIMRRDGVIYDCAQHISDVWYAFYSSSSHTSSIQIESQFRKRYPNANIDWKLALSRKKPEKLDDAFYKIFMFPAKWYVTYPKPDLIPDLSDKRKQYKWLNEQVELCEILKRYDIPLNCFDWKFKNICFSDKEGIKVYAVKASGRCFVICVLKVFTVQNEDNSDKIEPLIPLLTDCKFYGIDFR